MPLLGTIKTALNDSIGLLINYQMPSLCNPNLGEIVFTKVLTTLMTDWKECLNSKIISLRYLK